MMLCAVMLEEPISADAPEAIVKVKHMYQSCLNTSESARYQLYCVIGLRGDIGLSSQGQ